MRGWQRIGIAVASVTLGPLLAGCSGADASDVGDSEGASTAAATNPQNVVAYQAVDFEVPDAFLGKRDSELFTSEDNFRKFFGQSCGIVCTQPYQGDLSFTFSSRSSDSTRLLYVNKPEVPADRELVITSVTRESNQRWLHVETCTRPANNGGRTYALGLVTPTNSIPMIWVSAPDDGKGLDSCPE